MSKKSGVLSILGGLGLLAAAGCVLVSAVECGQIGLGEIHGGIKRIGDSKKSKVVDIDVDEEDNSEMTL